jgi:peptidyl-prolyl cis-trans isomerase C
MLKRFLIVAVAFFFVAGCDKLTGNGLEDEPAIQQTPIKGALLAQVNDWAIGTVDFEDKLDALKTLLPPEVIAELDDVDTKKKILQELVNFEILAQEAESRGLDKEQDVLDAVKNFRRNFLAQKILGDLYKEVTVPEVEIENFYDMNKGLFREPETRRVREIVVSTEAEAKNILIQLLQGQSFAGLARTYSIGKEKNQGGDLGELTIDEDTINTQKFPAFWRTVVTTEEGKSSSYFKGPEGFYLIKVEKVTGGDVKPLSGVRDNIREHLKGIQANRKKEDIIYSAKQKMKVVVNEDLLD